MGFTSCGAAGLPVAAKNLKCIGSDMSVDERAFEIADKVCLSHGGDRVLWDD